MKLIGTKAGETPDQTIIRCANNLVKAVIAARGMEALHSTSRVSSFDVSIYSHHPEDIIVQNILSEFRVEGRAAVKVTFRQEEPENDLTQDDAEGTA